METFACPLCGNPVTKSVYDKITGIWQERSKQLAKVRSERKELRKEILDQKRKLREQTQKFRREKTQLIKNAVNRQTKKLYRQMDALKAKETKLEARAAKKIAAVTASAHAKAEKHAEAQLAKFKRQIQASTRKQVKKEKRLARAETEKKYERLRFSFNATLNQMKAKGKTIQEQQKQITELERQLKRQTTPSLEGLLYEGELLRELKKRFPEDEYLHTGKGGDIVHSIRQNGEKAGVIVYECKRVKNYSKGHVTQAWKAKETRKADFAILVTNAMKRGTQGFYAEKGVLIVHPAGVLSLVSVLRGQVVQIADLKLGQLERDAAIRLTLTYLQGPEFSNSMEAIVGETISLYGDLREEVKRHVQTWKRRYDSYAKIHGEALKVSETTKAVLKGEKEYAKTLQPTTYPALIELPAIDDSQAS